MASNLVNLDAIIRREDWNAKPEANIQKPSNITFRLIEFEQSGLAFQILRKPEFQRETSSWEPRKVVDLVKSFLEGDLIPSVIIWKNSETGNLFVIDGAHRLGALIAWVHNDYGDGHLSRQFFNDIVPPEQLKAATDTRKEMDKQVGRYATIKESGNLPISVKEGRYARALTEPVITQVMGGSVEKAEASFFKINQQGTPILPTELRLIESRNKAYGISTRALVRAGVGHKFWKDFAIEKQLQIESLSKDVYSLLFKPPLNSPISVGLDLPIGGRGYSTEAIGLLFAFVNLTICPPAKKLPRGKRKIVSKGKDNPSIAVTADDMSGDGTISILQDVRNITTRMAGKLPRSLALHSAIYFYSATGRFQPPSFLAVASLIQELESEPGNAFFWFTIHRHYFEQFIARHRFLVNQTVTKFGGMEKSHEPVLDMFRTILLLSSERKTDSEIMQALKSKFDYLRDQTPNEFPASEGDATTAIKNAKIRKEGIEKVHLCHICNSAIHPNAISMEHKEDLKHGGKSSVENIGFSHPYCNSDKEALQAIFKNADPEAWRNVPTPKILCQQPLTPAPEDAIQKESHEPE